MADISVYTDPGTYQSEVLNPTSLALSSLNSLLTIIGTAPRVKQAINEPVRRGQVKDETLSFSATLPYRATLVNKGNRRKQDTQIYRNTDLLPDGAYSYVPASLTGPNLGAGLVIAANSYITLNLDGLGWIPIPLTAGATQTAALIATDINTALAADVRYGVAYSAVAAASLGAVVLTSPQTNATSDLRFIATPPATVTGTIDSTTAVFGVTAPYIAPTVIELVTDYYSGVATYSASYIAVNTLLDPLVNTGVQIIKKVGLYANVTSFAQPADYTLNGNSVDWATNTQVTTTSLSGPFDTSTANNLYLAINGLSAIIVALPIGAAINATQVALAINQALIASSAYGPLYGAVASVSGAKVVLTAPNQFTDQPVAQGANSTIEFFATPASALFTVFGIAASSTPYQITGSASQPVVGATYFATYAYTRPASDYNVADAAHIFTTSQDALNYCGELNAANLSMNQLGMAAEIAFENGAPRVMLIQVDDSTMPGLPSINQVKAAIDAAKDNDAITDMVVLDTRLSVQTYLMNHITNQSSILEKGYRVGWFGMARNTPVGDRDTADSFVYRSMVTLQVPPDSPGRGRMILTAPANVAKTFRMADGSDQKTQLNSTYVAAACAALQTSFLSVATSLLRKTVVGFDLDDFQVYTKAERRTLASNGVNVVTLVGGRLVLTDPVTTEQGAGNVVEFIEPSAIAQKDRVSRVVDQVIDTNLVGIVPSDIADFVNEIKGYLALAIRSLIESGDIARFKNADGTARDIDLSKDMQVYQSPTDPRTFRFRYYYNLKYPAKRFFGEYSVDNPFFSSP